MKIEGSASGSISQRHGSADPDPDPHQNNCHESGTLLTGMDGLVLVDALAAIMGHEEKELCKPGHLAMVLILDTATTITGSVVEP